MAAKTEGTVVAEKEAETVTEDIDDLLFKPAHDLVEFKVSEIFLEPSISLGVTESPLSSALSLTPKAFYREIKNLAEKRYQYTGLPKKMGQLKSLQTPENKISLLRDICIATGITLNLKQGQDLTDMILENDGDKLRTALTEITLKQRNALQTGKAKKNFKAMSETNLPDTEIFTYENLPIQAADIGDFYPILRHVSVENKDATVLMQQGRQAQGENSLEQAYECYSQAINVIMQINGSMNAEIASCISKMANIQYKFGDYLQAIELQTKSIVIQEKVLGFDSPIVAYSYSNLGLYYHTCRFFNKGFECMLKSLKILEVVAGSHHPDVNSILLNLGMMYQDVDNFKAAVECYTKSLNNNIAVHGEEHLQVVSCYQAIAHAQYLQEDFRKAFEFQERSHATIKKLLPEDSEYVQQS